MSRSVTNCAIKIHNFLKLISTILNSPNTKQTQKLIYKNIVVEI